MELIRRTLLLFSLSLFSFGCDSIPGVGGLEEKGIAQLPSAMLDVSFRPNGTHGERFEVEIVLGYDISKGCYSIPSGTTVRFNDTSLRGHTGLKGRGGECAPPRYTGSFDTLPAGPDGVVNINDGKTSISAKFRDLVAPRTFVIVGGNKIRMKDRNEILITPETEVVNEAYVRFYFKGEESSDPHFEFSTESGGDIDVAGNSLQFFGPLTGATGKGQLDVKINNSVTEVLSCEGVGSCEAKVNSIRRMEVELVYPSPTTE